jgi:hypothetical protein
MKRCGKRLTLLVALLACAPLAAHAPVVGRPDSDSLFKDRDPKLNANKQAVYHSGRDGVVQLFGNREKKPLPKTMSAKVVAVFADGDHPVAMDQFNYPIQVGAYGQAL